MGQHRCETLVLKADRHFRKRSLEPGNELVHIRRGFGVGSVEIERISENKSVNGVDGCNFLKIFYYICRRYSFQRGCEDTERVALCDSHTCSSEIDSHGSVHTVYKFNQNYGKYPQGTE